MPMEWEYFECACFSDEHTLKFVIDDEDPIHLYSSVFLNQYHNIFKRIWVALKYVFDCKCRYGHWDCWILRDEDADRLLSLIKKYQKLKKEQKTESKNSS